MTVRDVIKRALRMVNAIVAGEEPEADEMDDALTAYNGMIRGMFGHGVGQPLLRGASDATQALAGGLYAVPTLATPQCPSNGDRFGVVGATTINAAPGSTIQGGAQVVTVGPGSWFYRQDLADWRLENEQTLDDGPPFADDCNAGLAAMLAMEIAPEYGAEPSALVIKKANDADLRISQRYGCNPEAVIDPALWLRNRWYGFNISTGSSGR